MFEGKIKLVLYFRGYIILYVFKAVWLAECEAFLDKTPSLPLTSLGINFFVGEFVIQVSAI